MYLSQGSLQHGHGMVKQRLLSLTFLLFVFPLLGKEEERWPGQPQSCWELSWLFLYCSHAQQLPACLRTALLALIPEQEQRAQDFRACLCSLTGAETFLTFQGQALPG